MAALGSRRVWVGIALVLYLVALALPALSVRQAGSAVTTGSVAGYICLMFGLLLFAAAATGLTILFALSWLANVAWVISVVSLARGGSRAARFAVVAVGLGLLVLIPVITQAAVYDGADELIYGLGPGYLLWMAALGATLVGAAIAHRRPHPVDAVADAP